MGSRFETNSGSFVSRACLFSADSPALDQLSGRFSPSRGQFGILVCRTLQNKDLFIQRCRDTALDDRGFIIPLDDDDLGVLVEERQSFSEPDFLPLLKERFDRLVM